MASQPPRATPVYVTNNPDGGGASEETSQATLTSIGSTDDPAWNGTDTDASVIALLKAIALNTSTT